MGQKIARAYILKFFYIQYVNVWLDPENVIGFKSGNIKNTVKEVNGGWKHQHFDWAYVTVCTFCFNVGHMNRIFQLFIKEIQLQVQDLGFPSLVVSHAVYVPTEGLVMLKTL